MPPKKKKPTPIVVGTVSTRSTRRESIVNIEIIPKANKLTKVIAAKRLSKTALTTTNKGQPALIVSPEGTRPEILEILKDWSDDDTTQDDDIISVQSSSSTTQLAKDQQSLIDILEGKQSETQEVFRTTRNKSFRKKGISIENQVITIEDSPKVEEPEIIEECVVDDDTIIIEHIEDSGNSEEELSGNNTISCSATSKDLSNKVSEKLKIACEADEDIKSLTSEDTTSQSMITVQDECVSDNNNIHISDNSTSNYEIVEEQVVCDSSEPIITDSLDTALTGDDSKESGTSNKEEGNRKEKNEQEIVSVSGSSENSLEVPKVVSKDLVAETDAEQQEKKTEIQDTESVETTLCHKINESMQIIEDSKTEPQTDPAPDKLQDAISKMSIKNEQDLSTDSISSKSETANTSIIIKSQPKPVDKFSMNTIPRNTPPKNKNLKKLVESDSDVSPKISPRSSPKTKFQTAPITEAEFKQVRRSTRKKQTEHEAQADSSSSAVTSKGITTKDNGSSEMKNIKKNQEFGKDPKTNLIEEEMEIKVTKGKARKEQQKHTQVVNKMEVDSESSETKTSEAEGDSTSNESSQDQATSKLGKTKRKVSANLLTESSTSEITKKQIETTSSAEINVNTKYPKANKSKPKKDSKKESGEATSKVDIDFLTSQVDSVRILRSEIDVTIDEVLRKYTYEELDSSKNLDTSKELNTSKSKTPKDSKKKRDSKSKKDEKNSESAEEVRRSDRIKTILPVKKKSHGLVRSKSESALSADAETSDSNSDKLTPSVSPQLSKADKSKTKAKSSEYLQVVSRSPLNSSPDLPKPTDIKADKFGQAEIEARLKTFIHLKENQFKTDRQVCKEAKDMICDCYLAEEDIQKDEYGCGEDCLNRLLMIECGELCQVGKRCTNKRFQNSLFAPVEVFKTEKKGLGLRAAANIAYGEFILEYIGEVLNPDEFDKRAEVYSKDKNIHFYFMSLRADAIIDATMKGNISRFINHSCDPNAETQKWTVNGELRIGFFSTRTILAGEEITFDYRFQRYGKEAQKCYCEAATCRGWLGERPDESEDEEEEEEEEHPKVQVEPAKADVKMASEVAKEQIKKDWSHELLPPEKMDTEESTGVAVETALSEQVPALPQISETSKKIVKKKPRKETLFEDFDQFNEDIEMLVTTGLKNQAHTLKLSRLMVRAKDLEQRKKLLRVLRRGELPCRRLFLDYHGLRLMHGYMIDAQQMASGDTKVVSSLLEVIQTKLELLQTLAVLPIQNKTMLIESKVLPAVEKWAKNEDIIEDSDQKEIKKSPVERCKTDDIDSATKEKIDEVQFLATKLLQEWGNLKEFFRIPKKQRIEQMKEHEKEANRKFMESSYAQEKESSRKHDQRYRTWSRYKSERETNKKSSRFDDRDRPSAEFLKISKHERRKLFALQMELKEEERRMKQREMWRQHEMNCMMIGCDPRFTAPFDPSKGFQYIWNPSLGQWQALPAPAAQTPGVYNSPATAQGVSGFNVPPPHKQALMGPYSTPMINVPAQQYPGLQQTLPPMVPGLTTAVPAMANPVTSLSGISTSVSGMPGTLHGVPAPMSVIAGSMPGIAQSPLQPLPMYQEVKQEDPSQVKFAGPIPPPAKLPPKWKCAKDKYGRPYYYHVKIRKSQWEPPPLPEPVEESTESSSSDSSSGSSSDSSSDSDTDDEIDDAKLLLEVRKQMETTSKVGLKTVIPDHIKKEVVDSVTPSPDMKDALGESDNEDELNISAKESDKFEPLSSIDIRLKEQFNLDSNDPPKKKRRIGLCQEIIISPRTEEDRKHFKEDLKRYRATKEKLKRQKEQMLLQSKKKLKATLSSEDIVRKPGNKRSSKSRMKEMREWNDEHAKKIKEVFRSTMATTVVSVLNAYRKPDCKEARIANTEDFKHLARKLTHFVMLKEMKHLSCIEELVCSDNVKAKAREYIRKYMSKFGEVYQKRHDEPDFKD